MQLYFQNSFISLSYNRKMGLGKAKWIGRLQGPELREAFLLCLEMINQFNLTKWLADDRLMGFIEPTDLRWSLEVFVPRMAKSPVLRFAHLPSKFDANREAVEIMMDKGSTYKQSLVVREFTDEQEAIDWLMEPIIIPELVCLSDSSCISN